MDRIKRLSYEVLNGHKSRFGEDFAGNKKALDQISIVRSKGLKNEIAGYITKYIKKEIREEKAKQAHIAASKIEQQVAEPSEIEISEDSEIEETVKAYENIESTVDEISSETDKETTE